MNKYFYNLTKRNCANVKGKVIPSPPIKSKLGYFISHLADVKATQKKYDVDTEMAILINRTEWYKETKSKTVIINLFYNKCILCSDPKIWKEILGPKQEFFTNSTELNKALNFKFPNSIIATQGEQWQRIRKVVQNSMMRQPVDQIVYIICDSLHKVFKGYKFNEIRTHELLSRVIFDSFIRLVFNWDPNTIDHAEESLGLLTSLHTLSTIEGKRVFQQPIEFFWKLPTAENKSYLKAVDYVKNFTSGFAEKRRKVIKEDIKSFLNDNKKLSLLDALIISSEYPDENAGAYMSNDELIDQIITIFFGAYDTTSNTLSFIMNLLARNPDKQEKLRAYLKEKFPDGIEQIKNSKMKELDSISYLKHVIDEGNRLYPVFPTLSRDCIKDTMLGDYEVKKGMNIWVDSEAVGRNPEYWNGQTDMDDFRPERWAEYKPNLLETTMPFGFGGRICPGKKIAMAEMKVFISAIIIDYKIELRNKNEKRETGDTRFYLALHFKKERGNLNFVKL